MRVLLFVEREGRVVCVGRESTPKEAANAFLWFRLRGVCDFDGWLDESEGGNVLDAWDEGFGAEIERITDEYERRGRVGIRNFTAKGQAETDGRSWWLVECENADAGRGIITHHELLKTSIGAAFKAVGPLVRSKDPNRLSEPVEGRVLASGGKA